MSDEPTRDGDGDDAIPPIDFTTFVLSMSTACMAHLGEVAGPEGTERVNLPMARQTLDILAMLEDKTAGNLTGEEERILGQVLGELRDKYSAAGG